MIKGLGDGLSAEQIRAAGKISKVDYDSARKRMKGSAVFAGLKFAAKARFSEYFGPDALARLKELAETRRRELEDKKK